YKPDHEIDIQNRLLKIYFENWNADIANEGVVFFSNPIHTIDVSALGDGIYRVNVNLVKYSDAGISSMADGTLEKTAVLVKNNDNAELYMSFVPIDYLGGLSYTGGLWCEMGEKADGRFDESSMTVLSYYCNKDGSLMNNEIYDAITEIGCVKRIRLSLNDECKNEAGGYTLVVSSPAMAAMNGMAFEEIIQDDLLVNLMISNPEHLGSVEYAKDQIPVYDKSALLKEIKYAETFSEKEYTTDSWQMLAKTIEAAGKIYASAYSDSTAASAVYEEQIRFLKTAVANLEESTELMNAKEALRKVIDTAKAVLIDNKTESAYAKLQNAITTAENVYNNPSSGVSEMETAGTLLEKAIADFNNSKEASALDKNNLRDGIYSVHADMMKTDRVSRSMADNAINHTVKLKVINGEYYVTLDFRGITIENRFGYLKNLAYYADGYTYGYYGTVEGTRIPAEVLSIQKDSNGKDVVDRYNDINSLYPDLVRIKLVPSAIADKDGYVPLHVFVPIMEAIATGNGDQDVLMKIDWTTLKEAAEDSPEFQPEKPVEQSPAVDAADTETGIRVYAEPGVFEKGVKLIVNPLISGADYEKTVAALAEIGNKFMLYEIHFEDAGCQEVQPNGTVKVSFPIPAGYDSAKTVLYRINEDGSKTLIKGEVEGNYYTVITKSFSLYVLVEKDSVIKNEIQEKDTNSVNTTVPQTGDYTNHMHWFMLMISSAGILGVIMMIRKRKILIGE
ncbi:MAG: NEAT domain-containing protein, partial [Lachnospiraceae bacterium]|nr:NEAT domain-containing protein [Lachnospiraceae bacterium]